MRISTKGRYALRMLLDLAEHRSEGYIALKDIAERQNSSKKYLELRDELKLYEVSSYQGGYMLAKDPRECTVGDILRITEGSLAVVPCVEQDPIECKRSADCAVLPGGTGYITDLGMTGSQSGVLGVKTECVIRKFTEGIPVKFEGSDGGERASGAIFGIDTGTGLCVSAQPVIF